MSDDECGVGHLIWEGMGTPGSPLSHVYYATLCSIGLCYMGSLLFHSQVILDQIWSIVPPIYCWLLVTTKLDDARTILMAILCTLWGIRLSYNFGRRGGYSWPPWKGHQDYRWVLLQKGEYFTALKNPMAWQIFNLVVISIYQNVILFIMAPLPTMVAHLVAHNEKKCFFDDTDNNDNNTPLNWIDYTATILLLAFLLLETIADNQQYAFQTEKYRRINAKEEPLDGHYKDGYCQSGLYAVMRKPNYVGEQGIWCSFYLFSVAALWSVDESRVSLVHKLCNASMIGCLLLLSLFQGSSQMTEYFTMKKYPSYKDYQQRVPLFIPNLFGGSGGDKTKSS